MIDIFRFQRHALIISMIFSLGITSCQPARVAQVEEQPHAPTAAAWPGIDLKQAAAEGTRIFQLDAEASPHLTASEAVVDDSDATSDGAPESFLIDPDE